MEKSVPKVLKIFAVLLLAVLGFQACLLLKKKPPGPERNPRTLGKLEIYPLLILLSAPFMLHGLIGISHQVERSPLGIMARQLSPESDKLRVAGQPSDIAMHGYGAYSEGRHHSLVACMRFRGIILKNIAQEKDVFLGNNRWMREFFIHDKKLKSTCAEYLLATFSPFFSPGVHVIYEAPAGQMSPTYFACESERIVKQLHQMYAEPS